MWMIGALDELGFNSIGRPEPFEVRVFGTMNSPASFAAVLTIGILASVSRPLGFALPAVAVMSLAMALTQYRAGWGGLAVGLSYLLLAASAPVRFRILAAGVLLFLGTRLLATVPEMERTITHRLDTLTQLSNDESGQARLSQYAHFFSETEGLVVGQGLALSGATRRLDGRGIVNIDGGLMEPFLAFGVFGGTLCLVAVVGAFAATFSRRRRATSGHMVLYRAVAAAESDPAPIRSSSRRGVRFQHVAFHRLSARGTCDAAPARRPDRGPFASRGCSMVTMADYAVPPRPVGLTQARPRHPLAGACIRCSSACDGARPRVPAGSIGFSRTSSDFCQAWASALPGW